MSGPSGEPLLTNFCDIFILAKRLIKFPNVSGGGRRDDYISIAPCEEYTNEKSRVPFALGAVHGAKVAGTLDELPRKRGKETIRGILILPKVLAKVLAKMFVRARKREHRA